MEYNFKRHFEITLKKHGILEVVGISQVQPFQFTDKENKDRGEQFASLKLISKQQSLD